MFSDELGANASRKRAQEAKARRLKIKAATAKATTTTTTTNPAVGDPAVLGTKTTTTTPGTAATSSNIIVSSTTTTNATSSTKSLTSLSVVERAEAQRQLRAIEKRQKQASVVLQRFVRGHLGRIQVQKTWRETLRRGLDDILREEQVETEMVEKKNPTGEVSPPPATDRRRRRSDLLRLYVRLQWWEQTVPVVQLLLLPGLSYHDDPIIFLADWNAKSRRALLDCLLEYWYCNNGPSIVVVPKMENNKDVVWSGLVRCLRYLCRDDSSLRAVVLQRFRRALSTIPTSAETMRERCFTNLEKIKNGHMMKLCLSWIIMKIAGGDTTTTTTTRTFVAQILTCPLLSWRVDMAVASDEDDNGGWPDLLPLLLASPIDVRWLEEDRHDDSPDEVNNSDSTVTERCGSTAAQRILANLLTLPFPRHHNMVWYDSVTSLLLHVPYETFAGSSAVMWVDRKTQQPKTSGAAPSSNQKVAIVLNRVIVDQCKLLLVETHVRQVLQPYDEYDELTLSQKNAQDLQEEQALAKQGYTAAALAAKDAKATTNALAAKWQSSGFAQRLSTGIGKLLSGQQQRKNNDNGSARDDVIQLPNTSDNAKQLAKGPVNSTASSSPSTSSGSSCAREVFLAVVRTYAVIVSRWSGDGSIDILKNNNNGGKTTKPQSEPAVKSLMNVIGFSTKFLPMAWTLLQTDLADQVRAIHGDNNKDRATTATTPIRLRTVRTSDGGSVLYLFLAVFSHILIVTDDAELHEMDRPIPLFQIRRCIHLLKQILYRASVTDKPSATTTTALESDPFGLAMITASARTMRDLYDRSSRRPLCATKLWIVDSLLEAEIGKCKRHADYNALLQTSPILRVCPYMVPFKRRLKLFERLVTTLRVEIQGENSANPFHNNPLKPGIQIRITRGRLLEDGLMTMNNLGSNLRGRLSVHYYNQAGTKEQGIDAGGLFKEFWTDLCSIAFDPDYALFRVTETSSGVGNCLYPNPSSSAAHGDTHTTLFAFLGRILGKALFEGITIRPIFSHFTLSFLRGDYNFLHMLADLSTIEPQLYNNLMFLKTYDGDASDLALSFTVTVEEFGGTREIPLLPNGADMEVTNSNKHLYIGLVAKYYVYDRIREQSEAMTRGLLEVIDRSWIQIFNEPELQVLISGASDGKLDVDDMRQHCQYAGGYSAIDPSILRFWSVVASMNEKHQSALLRFVTSCERPPPLGFRTLNPPFTIQRVGVFRDGERLPTASTCFNVLKLPTYSSEKVMRERLIYAIESGAGFELS
jgi:ubiquitin-protein ligase E3 C